MFSKINKSENKNKTKQVYSQIYVLLTNTFQKEFWKWQNESVKHTCLSIDYYITLSWSRVLRYVFNVTIYIMTYKIPKWDRGYDHVSQVNRSGMVTSWHCIIVKIPKCTQILCVPSWYIIYNHYIYIYIEIEIYIYIYYLYCDYL